MSFFKIFSGSGKGSSYKGRVSTSDASRRTVDKYTHVSEGNTFIKVTIRLFHQMALLIKSIMVVRILVTGVTINENTDEPT